MTRHGWTYLNVADYTRDAGTSVYPAASFHPSWANEYHRCSCHTQLCTRVATQEDLLCDECREHPECFVQPAREPRIAIDH